MASRARELGEGFSGGGEGAVRVKTVLRYCGRAVGRYEAIGRRHEAGGVGQRTDARGRRAACHAVGLAEAGGTWRRLT